MRKASQKWALKSWLLRFPEVPQEDFLAQAFLRFPEVPQEDFLALEGLYRAFADLVRADRMTDKSQDMK